MGSILKCFNCNQGFDLNAKSPRILPCNASICSECILQSAQLLSGYSIKCKCDQGLHNLKNLDEIYPCHMVIDYLKRQDVHSSHLEHLRTEMYNSKFSLNMAKYEAGKIYESIGMDIDIKAETLISQIHEQREQMMELLKEFNTKTAAEFDAIEEYHSKKHICLEQNFNDISERLSSGQASIDNQLSAFLKTTNEIQRSIENIKQRICTFNQNNDVTGMNLFGQLTENTVIENYKKIKNLSSYEHVTTSLQTQCNTAVLRQFTICLNRTRTINANFTSGRSVSIELLNEKGEVLKVHQLKAQVLYYPIMANTSSHFVLCYPSSSGFNHSTDIVLFDAELNLISSLKSPASIESIYMDKENIVCTFANRKSRCCHIYNYSFTLTGTFGQQKNRDEPFFFENGPQDTNGLRSMLNPIVFGLTNERIFTCTKTHIVIYCRENGSVIYSTKRKSQKSVFYLDGSLNIIEIDLISKEIFFVSADFNLSTETRYTFDVTEVSLVENNFFAFINSKKRFIVLV